MIYYYDSAQTETLQKISRQLAKLIRTSWQEHQEMILLCIGSDRSTGDSLGPILGYKLVGRHFKNVYGTLDHPVHAANLSATLAGIYRNHNNPFIIAVDASLGIPEHVGYITLGLGPLFPGLGVQKKLPKVGDIHITGIVNNSNSMDTSLLQTTHLCTVVKIADILSNALCLVLQAGTASNVYSYMQQPLDQSCPQRLTS